MRSHGLYSAQGHKESDTTEQLSLSTFQKPLYVPAISLLGIYPEETKTEKDACTPMFITALFAIAKTWKHPRCPSTDEWLKEVWYIHTVEYYSAIIKECI